MTHAEMDELYDLYALGALEAEPASEIDRHVAEGCEYCVQHIHQSVNATALLAGMADSVEPPRRVRQRLLASFGNSKTRRWAFAVPLLALACTVLLVLSVWSYFDLVRTRHDLARISGERRQLQEALAVLSSSQPQMVQFGGPAKAPRGSVFVNHNGGFVMTGSQMPEIANDKAFELWLIPKSGSPIPAGVFQSMPGRNFVHVYREPVQINQISAVAVTVEGKEGSLAPTTKPFLVVPLS